MILRYGSCVCVRKGGAFWDTSGSVEPHSYRGLENADELTESGRFHWSLQGTSILLVHHGSASNKIGERLDVPKGKGRVAY